jgi:predicted metalloenzyme YecM
MFVTAMNLLMKILMKLDLFFQSIRSFLNKIQLTLKNYEIIHADTK